MTCPRSSKLYQSMILIVCALALLLQFCNSGGGGSDTKSGSGGTGSVVIEPPQTVQRINAYGKASTGAEKAAALAEIAVHCRSLGVLDENGIQLNSGSTTTAINLTTSDMILFSDFVDAGSGQSMGEVIGFLEDFGVLLASDNSVITFSKVQSYIQDYINWSFAHQDDPDSTLGMLIASGPELIVPNAAPIIESSTLISPMTSILILADIIVGVHDPARAGSPPITRTIKEMGSDLQEAAANITGLFKIVATFEKAILQKLNQNGKTFYDLAKGLIGKFAAGSHLKVGYFTDGNSAVDAIELKSTTPQMLTVGIVVAPGNERIAIDSLSADYSLDLTETIAAANEQGTIDYQVVFDNDARSVSFNAPLSSQPSLTVTIDKEPAAKGKAIIHGSATLHLPNFDLDAVIDEEIKKLEESGKHASFPWQNTLLAYIRANNLKDSVSTLYSNIKTSYGKLAVNVDATPEPLAVTISADPQEAYTDEHVFFNSTVTGGKKPYLYRWEFGDNESSTLHDDTHSYSAPGTYTVNLTVTDADNNEITATPIQVKVLDQADEYVIYYTDNVRCWGAPWLYIGTRNKFNATEYRCDQPGGGVDCTQELAKVEIQGGFLTSQEASNWICPKITGAHYSYWCGGPRAHWIVSGQELDFRLGNLGCGDLSSVPDVDSPDPHPGM